MISLDLINQIGILATGVPAIILVGKKNRWGFVLGFLSSPFWFATSIMNGQWGVLLSNFFYTGSWVFGIYEWFFKKDKRKRHV